MIAGRRKCVPARRTTTGLTLVELMVTLAVLAILAAVGVPSMQDMIRTNQVASQSNELISLLAFARSEAIRRGTAVDAELERAGGAAWTARIFVVDDDGNETVLRQVANERTALSRDIALRFTNRGYLDPFVSEDFSLQHVNCTRGRHQRDYTLERVGRLNFAEPEACDGG